MPLVVKLYKKQVLAEEVFPDMATLVDFLCAYQALIIYVGQPVYLLKESGLIQTTEPPGECLELIPHATYAYTESLRKRLARTERSYRDYCDSMLPSVPIPEKSIIVGRSSNMSICPEEILDAAIMASS